jgi:hypothetical protein
MTQAYRGLLRLSRGRGVSFWQDDPLEASTHSAARPEVGPYPAHGSSEDEVGPDLRAGRNVTYCQDTDPC